MTAGRIGLALGGAAIGGFIGGPTGARIGFTLGNLAGGILFADSPEGQTIQGPRLTDLDVTTSTYGKGIPQTYGSVRVPANMIWATDIQEIRKEETQGGGGKGGPSQPESTSVTFEYFGNFAMAFGAGEKLIRRVWANKKLIVDLSDEFAAGSSKTFKYNASIYRFYTGTETQLPDPLIEADKGVGNVPGHRGLVYMVFDQLPLRDFGNRIPQIEAELVDVASTAWTAVNSSINPTGGTMEADNDFIDKSGFTSLGYNLRGSRITIYNRASRTGVDQMDMTEVTNAQAQAILGGSPGGITGFTGDKSIHVDPSSGMMSFACHEIGMTTSGGVCLFIGVLNSLEPDDPVRDFREGTWQYVDTSGNVNVGPHRVYVIDGVRRFFMATGLVTHNFLRTAPFKFFNIGSDVVPEIIEVVATTAQNVLNSTQFSGTIDEDEDDVVGGDWQGSAYDPVNERCWFHDDLNFIVMHDGSFGTRTDLGAILDALHTSGGTFEVRGIAYDTVNEVLVVACVADHFTIDPVTYAVIQSAGPNTANAISDGGAAGHITTTTGNLWVNQDTVERVFYEVTTVDQMVRWSTDDISTPLQRYNEADIGGDTWSTTIGPYYDSLINAFYNNTGDSTWVFIDRFESGGILLSALVTQIIESGGVLGAADLDVTELTDTVRGYVIQSPMTQRKMIEPLQAAFFFDGAEIDGKIVFKKRTGSSLKTITSDQLGAKVAGQATQQKLIEPRKQEVEVPRQVDVSYLNTDNDYQIGTQRDQRIQDDPANNFTGITRSRQTAEIQLPIVLSDAEARDIAATALSSGWVERTSLSFTLPPQHMALDPTDIITIQKISSALTADLTVRLTEVEMGPAGVLNCSGLLVEAAVFMPNTNPQVIDGTPADAIPFPAGTNLFLLNLPNLLGPSDDQGGAWWGAAPDLNIINPSWVGSILFRALSLSDPFIQVDTTVRSVAWGLMLTEFPGHANFTTQDRTNTIRVTLQSTGSLSSISELAFFAGGNAAYIPSTGELLQFQTATLVADSTYDLTVHLRGRLGTEVFVSGTNDIASRTALAGAEIIFLGDLSTFLKFSGASERGLSREYEAVTLGGQLGSTGNDQETFTNASAASLPLSPSNFIGTRDGSDNIDLTWNNRTRYSGELLDLVDVPLNEVGEEYEIDVLDSPTPEAATVIKVVTGLIAQSYEYLAVDQDIDVWDGVTPSDLDFTPQMVNAGFETDDLLTAQADITGWNLVTDPDISPTQSTNATPGWVVVDSAGSITVAHEGSKFVSVDSTSNRPSLESDLIPLTGLAGDDPLNITELATNPGRYQIAMTMREGNGSADADTGGANIRFFDEDRAFISELLGTKVGHAAADVWFSYTTGPTNIPTNARFFTIRLVTLKIAGGSTLHSFDDITWSVTDTDSGAVQRFAFDVFQMSATTGRGRGRRVIAPAVGQ